MRTLKLFFKSGKVVFGLSVFLFLFIGSITFTALSPKDPTEMVGTLYNSPSKDYPLGTDNFGRDVLVELIYGIKTSVIVGLSAGILATLIGTIIGTIAGFTGKWVDNVLNSLTNLFLVIPSFVILVLLAVSLQKRSLMLITMVIGVTSWPWTARAVRAQASSLKTREHISMARLNGKGNLAIMFAEVLPYMLSYIFMVFVIQSAGGILNEAGLSMLGLGPENTISLGVMLSWALNFEAIRTGAWWAFFPPVFSIAVITFSLYLVNIGMDEIFNPRLRK